MHSICLSPRITTRPQNGELLPFVEKRVRVTGKVIEKDGIKAIVLEQVSAAE